MQILDNYYRNASVSLTEQLGTLVKKYNVHVVQIQLFSKTTSERAFCKRTGGCRKQGSVKNGRHYSG